MSKTWSPPLLVIMLTLPLPAFATALDQVPNPRKSYGGWVSDTANLFSPSTETELNRLINGLEQRTTAELAVVTVPNTQGYASPKAFTTQLFNYWGIGKAKKNNGILFLISVGDRRVEIETGKGLGSQLPDARVAQIINTQITPRFREGDFEGGTLAGVRQLIAELERGVASGTSRSGVGFALVAGSLLLVGIWWLGLAWQLSRRPLYLRSGSSGQRAMELKQLDQRNGGVRLFLYGGSLLLGVFGAIVSQNLWVSLLPLIAIFATDRTLQLRRGIPFHSVRCERCRQPMQQIKPTELHSYLSKPESFAHSQGMAYYYGWLCPTCRGVSTLVAEKPLFSFGDSDGSSGDSDFGGGSSDGGGAGGSW